MLIQTVNTWSFNFKSSANKAARVSSNLFLQVERKSYDSN